MWAWLALAVVGVGFGGCVFGDDDTGGGPYVGVEDIVHQYDIALCQHLVTCHEFADQATCVATNVQGTLYIDPFEVQAALAGKLRYNGSLVAQCFAQLAASTCNPGDLANRRPIGQCLLGMFVGAGPSGAACSQNVECASGSCATSCEQDQQCCLGTCVGDAPPAPAPLVIGDACPPGTGAYDACPVGAYCDTTTTSCTAVKPQGAHCQRTAECGDGLQCDVFTTLTCVEASHVSEPCTPAGHCGDEGLYCGNDQLCHYVALAGEPCGAGQQCSSYTMCDPDLATCVAYPSTGGDCSVAQRCNDVGTYCDGSVCRALKANGQPCQSDAECASVYCDAGVTLTCVPAPTCPLS
ncbi:MAG: Dickkopf N-terminal cysteine-rich domain-containing protein [Kofleriaceae bacterium]